MIPYLDCPGSAELAWEVAEKGLSYTERQARDIDLILACHQDLLDQGFNPAGFNSAENAADVYDLRLALGYQQVSLYGVS